MHLLKTSDMNCAITANHKIVSSYELLILRNFMCRKLSKSTVAVLLLTYLRYFSTASTASRFIQ